ncbi:cell division protein FtsQ/DivIB [Sandaracinobacteroides saxicola]|uniref:Cell division protein FtsQ n=1 Tax=Sandaracinobacteroides saxicola TaxID=2759707 RepID=A0A7G5IG80_9SPHN|nr:FtsQ-type POTRA domain-containing protein [Sandaracinobacteroides saxicola]QMW22372.1 FtsQ-type POTRA domain-containing protein [Sandaracinobacteroides saxicola]
MRGKPAAAPVRVPMAPARLRRLLGWGSLSLGLVAGTIALFAAGLPQRALFTTATFAAGNGFAVRQVQILGQVNQPRLSIYRETLTGATDSMLLVDLDGIRNRVKSLPWVADASVARRWPDTLVIRVTEKRPIALWQYRQRLTLIDRNGQPLPSDDLTAFGALPIVIGATANDHAHALLAMLATQPRVAAGLDSATFVGDRRWDVRLKTGETLALPEGPAASVALRKFAELDRRTPLTGRGFLRFDLRLPDKMVVRVAADARPKPMPPGVTI